MDDPGWRSPSGEDTKENNSARSSRSHVKGTYGPIRPSSYTTARARVAVSASRWPAHNNVGAQDDPLLNRDDVLARWAYSELLTRPELPWDRRRRPVGGFEMREISVPHELNAVFPRWWDDSVVRVESEFRSIGVGRKKLECFCAEISLLPPPVRSVLMTRWTF